MAMKLSSQQTIDRSCEDVFAAVTDFGSFESLLRDMGVKVTRLDGPAPPEVGARWTAKFNWQKRSFDAEAELVMLEPNACYGVESRTEGIECMAVVDVEALSADQTRLFVSFDLSASTFKSKIFLKTLSVTSSSINRRLDKRLESLARRIEKRP